MANKTISDLRELSTVSNSNVLVVETNAETFKVTKENLLKEVNEELNTKSNINHTHDEYVTESELNAKGYATETFVTNKIAEASLSGGDNVSSEVVINQNGGNPLKIWAGTQVEYDSLVVKDEETIYLIDKYVGEDSGGSPQLFDVTNKLINCTTTNSTQSIESGSTYVATIVVNDGYKINNVVITVNGINVTQDVFLNNNITIPQVNGDIVITITCIEDIINDGNMPTPIYNLPGVTQLDGSNTIDTDIALFDRDKDFTLFMSFETDFEKLALSPTNTFQYSLFRVKRTSSPWIGVDCCIHDTSGALTPQSRGEIIGSKKKGYYLGKISTGVTSETTSRQTYLIKRVKADKKMYFYDSQGLMGSYADAGDVASNPFNTKIIIGGYDDKTTKKIIGTVYDFKIWETALSDNEIANLFEGGIDESGK